MSLHYDLPLALFESFLGPRLKYSMALWEDGIGSLEAAQERMLEDLCDKANVEDGQTILDLGCGFGSFASYALEHYPNAEVVGLNLSKIQCEFLRGRQSDPTNVLATPRFSFLEADFNFADFNRRFDRVVSIGFFEHVADLSAALARIEEFLEPEGRCFLHFIVRSGGARAEAVPVHGCIGAQIFPGGRIHPYEALSRAQGRLQIERQWFIDGSHYRRTLEAWLESFRGNQEALLHHRVLEPETLKMWELYLMGCSSVFRARRGHTYGNGQYLLRRPRAD